MTRPLAVLGAVAAPALIWLVTVLGLGHHLIVYAKDPPLDVNLVVVVLLALASALLGWLLLVVLERLTRHARVVWAIASLAVLLLSFALLLDPGTPMSTKFPLGLMHVAVAAVLVPVLYATSQRSKASSS
ncbi:DUF6069 family protein [Dactylosporangium sp. NPDC051541]|uniref:DUF6069 family protein n=1 Tax=Dactylosporangium sp. NPDC051541 TaxID=3363977 RepID=UPI0037A77BC7